MRSGLYSKSHSRKLACQHHTALLADSECIQSTNRVMCTPALDDDEQGGTACKVIGSPQTWCCCIVLGGYLNALFSDKSHDT